ncbi:hypothetical protein GCM10027160_10160 [Streptomyces calidiresistens]
MAVGKSSEILETLREVRSLLRDPDHGLAASRGALTATHRTVTEDVSPGLAGLQQDHRELRTRQNRIRDGLAELRTAVEALRRELAETRAAVAGTAHHRAGEPGADPGTGIDTTHHGEPWGTTGRNGMGREPDKAGDRRGDERRDDPSGAVPDESAGAVPEETAGAEDAGAEDDASAEASASDGHATSVAGEGEPETPPAVPTGHGGAEEAEEADRHPAGPGSCGDVPEEPEGEPPTDPVAPEEAGGGAAGAGGEPPSDTPGPTGGAAGGEEPGDADEPPSGGIAEGEGPGGEHADPGEPPAAEGPAEDDTSEDEAFVASLDAAAGIATARLLCHRDTWQFLLEHTVRHPHFRVPDRVTDLAGGRTEAFLSGRSLLAVLVTTRDLQRNGAADPVGRALAGTVHQRARRAVAGTGAPVGEADSGSHADADVITIVLDDRPTTNGG